MPKKVQPEQVEQQMQQYMENTVNPNLDNMFLPSEGSGNDHKVDRGNHIVINGRTVKEIIAEEFRKTHDPSDSRFSIDFKNFYYKQGKALVSQRVAAAVMSGQQVDVYVPDPKTGKIKDTPARITKSGYEPNPINRPQQMNRWQKFWSRFGFYKDKVAEQANYAARSAARDRVKLYNKASRINSLTLFTENAAIGDAWGEKYPERKGIDVTNMSSQGAYRLSRQGMACYVNCVLARQKGKDGKPLYTNEQLFNMTDPKMQVARADAAEEIYQHNLKNDTDWLVTLHHDSKTILTERINEQGKKIDFSKPDVTEQRGYREYVQLNNTAFEVSQEITSTSKELDAKYGKGEHDSISAAMGELPNVVKIINGALESQSELMSGITGTESGVRIAVATVMAAQAAQQHFAKLQKDPKIPASEYAKGKIMDAIAGVRNEAQRSDDEVDMNDRSPINEKAAALEKEYLEDPAKITKQISTGVFAKRIKLKSLNLDDKSSEPAELDVLDAQTAERQMNTEKSEAGMEL